MIFKDGKTYDRLKFIALLILPVGTFLSTFCGIWFSEAVADQIMQTFAALDVLAGAVVVASNRVYKVKNNARE